jgi:hypothetical protein
MKREMMFAVAGVVILVLALIRHHCHVSGSGKTGYGLYLESYMG